MDQTEKLLSIGQFAALHGINKKTLMWYDEIGLFRPAAINPENGYRCYHYRQSPILETILLLRELDVSLPEIQEFMKHRSAEHMKDLLKEKLSDLDLQIMHLKAVQKNLSNRLSDMETLLTMDLSEISIIEKEERCLVTVDIDSTTTYEQEVELITAQTAKYRLGRLHDASYGSMIPVERLLAGDYEHYTKLFIEIPFLRPKDATRSRRADGGERHDALLSIADGGERHDSLPSMTDACERHDSLPSTPDGLHVQPDGAYLKAFHKGDWSGIPLRYQELLAWARSHGLMLSGYSYEKGINEAVIDRMEDYIVQIEIPVKKQMR